jgi:hypothetical protein
MSTLATNAITDASGGNTATINSYTPTESNMAGRNKIINGSMVFDQRNAGASVTLNTWGGQFPVDRFRGNVRPSIGTISAQQSTVVPSGQGFYNSLKLTQASVTTEAANDVYSVVHNIEGYNIQEFQFGTAEAKELVLSFWVKSSITGTYSVSFSNELVDRSLIKEYTISAADTWQKISIPFSADSTGTWSASNSTGLRIFWDLGGGTDYRTTPNSWTSGDYRSSVNQVRWIDTSGATFYITGVQLEAGSVATPFERRQYGQELALCSRYFWKISGASANNYVGAGFCDSSTAVVTIVAYPVRMRAIPTLQTSGTASDYNIRWAGGNITTCNNVPTGTDRTEMFARIDASVSGGLTTGYGGVVRNANTNGFFAYTAEL